MKTVVAVLLVTLSGQGHWFGGREGEVLIQWTAGGKHPESVLEWELRHGKLRLAEGVVALPADGKPSVVRITPPAVRVRTAMTFSYRAKSRDGKELETGSVEIHLYPDSVLDGLAARVKGKTVLVWEGGDDLTKLLKRADVPAAAIQDPAVLQTAKADIILVGPGMIEEGATAEVSLLGHATAGSSVFFFAQAGIPMLMGYPLAVRHTPAKLEWRLDHPLLAGFDEGSVQSWLAGWPSDLTAVQLPADEPALEIAWWPREVPGRNPVPIDALIVSKAAGKGRIVLCQLPLGDWEKDPRSQLFFRNVMEYLVTRPEPTLPPSKRQTERKAEKPDAAAVPGPAEAKGERK